MLKTCKKCNIEKEEKHFQAGRYTCIKCKGAASRQRILMREDGLEVLRQYQREYQKRKRASDPHYDEYYRILYNVRKMSDTYFTTKYGYTLQEFQQHIEAQFTPLMSWANYGTFWEIDHIIPVLRLVRIGYTETEINRLSNLRPLSITDNRSRPKKWIYDEKPFSNPNI